MSAYLDILGPFQAPLAFLLVIAGPPIFRTLSKGVRGFLNPQFNGQAKAYAYNPAAIEPRQLPHAFFYIVGIHTAIFAYIYYYMQPFNLFTRYFLPVTANARILHSAIHNEETGRASPAYPNPLYQHNVQPGHIPTSYLDILAKKLTNSLDNRLLYLRFGHSAFTAAWTRTIPEYMLIKLPEVGFWYLMELGVCVLLLCNVDWKGKGGYKQSFSWIIVLAGMAEVWARLFWPIIVVEGEAVALDNIIFTVRTIFLGLLPILLMLLPENPPESVEVQLSEIAGTIKQTSEIASQALTSLSFAAPSTRFLRTMDEMILANPELRDKRISQAEREKLLRDMIMNEDRFRTATDNAYGWVDDDEEITSDGNVKKRKGKALVTNGMREVTKRQLSAQWNNFEKISEAYELQRTLDVVKSQTTRSEKPPPMTDMSRNDNTAIQQSKVNTSENQGLKKRTKSGAS
ncbi:hypothetical protein QFC22_005437 [Naganishia vaughanmartiniae]|uniref:Uncharacterized protein n=1 Tax=Naganishia vaughanmartiniae TaxID=1424756 RepID=A0ACC2WVP7_9TREE|nr:hypothetical protein QFC22_005437 [Naganishia vaughanmartiniae]